MRTKLWVFCSLAVALFAYGNWFSWRKLNLAYIAKVKGQSAFLRAVQAADKAGDALDDSARPTHRETKEKDVSRE